MTAVLSLEQHVAFCRSFSALFSSLSPSHTFNPHFADEETVSSGQNVLEQSSGLELGAAYDTSKRLLQTQSSLAGAGQTLRPPGSRYKTTGSSRGCDEAEAHTLHSATQMWQALPWGKLGSVLLGLPVFLEKPGIQILELSFLTFNTLYWVDLSSVEGYLSHWSLVWPIIISQSLAQDLTSTRSLTDIV